LACVAPAAAAVLGVALVGCPSTNTTTTLFTPITGIEIDSASLVFGFGCGTGSTEVFKYAAILQFSPPPPDGGDASFSLPDGGDAGVKTGIASGVFDCFVNAAFSNLCPDGGTCTPGSSSFTIQIFAFNEASFPPELASCDPGEGGTQGPCTVASAVIHFESMANWTAVCTATQVVGVTVPAVCGPLVPVGAQPGQGDAGSDASASDAGSTGDAADGGAGG
jgi:hypothetical protein